MIGEPTLRPPAPSAAIAGLTAMVVTFACWAGLLVWLEPPLYEPYAEVLGWGTNRSYLGPLTIAAMLAGFSCGSRGWRGLPMALLAGSVFAATAVANVVAATVALSAPEPSLVTTPDGRFICELAGLLPALPKAYGTLVLMRRWQGANVPLREWFRNENLKPRRGYGFIAAAVGFITSIALAAWLEDWLAAAYPAASTFPTVGIQSPALAVMGLMLLASPYDLVRP
jgi:hypothetical protein